MTKVVPNGVPSVCSGLTHGSYGVQNDPKSAQKKPHKFLCKKCQLKLMKFDMYIEFLSRFFLCNILSTFGSIDALNLTIKSAVWDG